MQDLFHIVRLESDGQRLDLVPGLGGAVAAWQKLDREGPLDLWRPWDRATPDLYRVANFAMLPWANRISAGGFEFEGRHYPVAPNREGEPYPIHGDGWLQPWTCERVGAGEALLRLASRGHGGNPYVYAAEQRLRLCPGGLDQLVEVTHLGEHPLPYGLGLHPWFVRTPGARVQAQVQGVWLCGDDPIPTGHTEAFPPGWDLRRGVGMDGPLIDNCYTGWDGAARIEWPERGLALTMQVATLQGPSGDIAPQYCLLYRPPRGEAFCFEPVTQPIDAFHLPGRPGLQRLAHGERLRLEVRWRWAAL